MKFFKVFFVIFVLLAAKGANAEFIDFSDSKKVCLELVKSDFSDFNLDEFNSNELAPSTNDGILGLDFLNIDLFTKDTFTYGNKSSISKGDLFRVYDIYGIDLSNTFFYENELNFVDIEKNGTKEFLSCYFSKGEVINGDIKNLKKGDVTVSYTSYPSSYEITELVNQGKKWKKIVLSRIFKDKLGKTDVFKIDTTYYVPSNKNLEGFYNLYELVEEFGTIINWFDQRIKNQGGLISRLREVYNKNGVQIKMYFLGGDRMSDPYGIKYVYVNGMNFFNDFIEYKRHNLFESLIKDESPLVKNIYIIENKWDNERNAFVEPQIDFVSWVLYFLGDLETIDKEKIDLVPYYSREFNFLNNSFYKTSGKISRDDFRNYMGKEIFNDKNISKPDTLLEVLKEVSVEGNYSEFVELHDEFEKDFKDASEANNDEFKKALVKKYSKIFPNDAIFKNNPELTTLKNTLENTDILSENNDDSEEEEYGAEKNNIIIIIALIILFIVSGFFILKKNKKK